MKKSRVLNYVHVGIVCLLNIFIIFLMFVPLGLSKYLESSNLYIYGVTSIFGSVLLTLATVLYFKFVAKKPIKLMQFRWSRRDALFTLAVVAITTTLLLLFFRLLVSQGLVSGQLNPSLFSEFQVVPLLLVIGGAWLIAAFSEEVLYRGFMVSMLSHLSTRMLFIVTSVFFMLSHVFKGLSPLYVLFLLIGAVTLLYVYLKGRSIITVTIVHAGYNFTTNHLIGNSDISLVQLQQQPDVPYLMLTDLLFYAVVFILTFLFYRKNSIRDQARV